MPGVRAQPSPGGGIELSDGLSASSLSGNEDSPEIQRRKENISGSRNNRGKSF